MTILDLTDKGIFLKLIFDGYDFTQTRLARMLVSPQGLRTIYSTTYLPTLYENSSQFINYCLNNSQQYIPNILTSKYKVGVYNLTSCFDETNPWYNNQYILFNNQCINAIKDKVDITGISFYVCPSFNEQNEIEAIGFRVVNTESVLNSFKWLFTCGNNIIYGKNTVDKNEPCYIVEGFRDYVALNELGYNVIGLGSVSISKQQEEYIDGLNAPILLLDNDSFGLKKTLQYKNKYRIATLVQTLEKDAYDTWIKYGKINIKEII